MTLRPMAIQDTPADASFILNSKEHAVGGGRNELHYAQAADTVADVVRPRRARAPRGRLVHRGSV
jgi:hypothetical protein